MRIKLGYEDLRCVHVYLWRKLIGFKSIIDNTFVNNSYLTPKIQYFPNSLNF